MLTYFARLNLIISTGDVMNDFPRRTPWRLIFTDANLKPGTAWYLWRQSDLLRGSAMFLVFNVMRIFTTMLYRSRWLIFFCIHGVGYATPHQKTPGRTLIPKGAST